MPGTVNLTQPVGTLPRRGEVAQLVEHTAENRGVAGSSPALATRDELLDEAGSALGSRRRLQPGGDRRQPPLQIAVRRAARRSRPSARRACGRRCRGARRSPSRARAARCRTGPRRAAARPSACRSRAHSVTVLLPPCVITRSTCGRIEVCGRNSAPAMLSASSSWSCCGPFETITRYGAVGELVDQRAHQLDVGRAERAEAEVDERAVPAAQGVRAAPTARRSRARSPRGCATWRRAAVARG